MKKGLLVVMFCLVLLMVGVPVSEADGPVRPIEDGPVSNTIVIFE